MFMSYSKFQNEHICIMEAVNKQDDIEDELKIALIVCTKIFFKHYFLAEGVIKKIR